MIKGNFGCMFVGQASALHWQQFSAVIQDRLKEDEMHAWELRWASAKTTAGEGCQSQILPKFP